MDIWTSDYCDIAEVGSAANKKGQIDNYGSQHNVFNNLFTINFDGKFGDEQEWGLNVVLGNEFNDENIRRWSYTGTNFNFYGLPTIGNATSYSGSEYSRKERTVGFLEVHHCHGEISCI